MGSNEIPRMTEGQRRRVRRLILHQCANCDGGNCLPLDDGDACPCPQLLTPSLVCRYFRAAVLPDDAELRDGIMAKRPMKRCALCGTPIAAASNAAKYCPSCAGKERRRQDRERKRNQAPTSANRGPGSPVAQGFSSANGPGDVKSPTDG